MYVYISEPSSPSTIIASAGVNAMQANASYRKPCAEMIAWLIRLMPQAG